MSVSNTNRWKLGLFVTVGAAALVGVLLWTGVSQMQRRTFTAYFYFDETVNGLDIGSPVKFRGVVVGRVEDIDPAQDRKHVEVRTGLYVDALGKWGVSPPRQRREGAAFVEDRLRGQLVTSALTQTSIIQIDFFSPERYPIPTYTFPLPWETIHAVPSTFKSLEDGLMEALERWPEISQLAQELMRNVNQGVIDLQLGALSQEVQKTLVDGRGLIDKLRGSPFIDNDSPTLVKLRTTLDEVNGLVAELGGDGGQIDRAVDRFDSLGQKIELDLEHSDIPGTFTAWREAGEGVSGSTEELVLLVRDLRAGIADLQIALHSISTLAELLSRDPSALIHGKTTNPAPFRR